MNEPQTSAAAQRPPGRGTPPAPPGTDDPGRPPNPRDPGPPITVRLDAMLLGDLGNARVDARLVNAVLLREGRVGRWLQQRGISVADVERAFPQSDW
jgi:hypothetical protein